MSEITIGGMPFKSVQIPKELQPFQPAQPGEVEGAPGASEEVNGAEGASFDGFTQLLEKEIDGVNETMAAADEQVGKFLRGEERSVHDVMIAMTKADTSFRMMTQVARRVVEAYQEVMRMQV